MSRGSKQLADVIREFGRVESSDATFSLRVIVECRADGFKVAMVGADTAGAEGAENIVKLSLDHHLVAGDTVVLLAFGGVRVILGKL